MSMSLCVCTYLSLSSYWLGQGSTSCSNQLLERSKCLGSLFIAWNVGWLRETDRHCHLLSCSGLLTLSHGGNMTFIARFVHIKQVRGKIKFGQKYAISDTGGTQDGNGSN